MTNSEDPDQTAPDPDQTAPFKEQSDQGLLCFVSRICPNT